MFPFVYSILEQDRAERDHGAGWGPWENLPRELLSARNGSLLTNSPAFQYSLFYSKISQGDYFCLENQFSSISFKIALAKKGCSHQSNSKRTSFMKFWSPFITHEIETQMSQLLGPFFLKLAFHCTLATWDETSQLVSSSFGVLTFVDAICQMTQTHECSDVLMTDRVGLKRQPK